MVAWPALIEPMQVRHRRIEREETVERQRRRLAVERERVVAAQPDPVGIADRRDGGEPVERAAQDDRQEARVAALGAAPAAADRPRRTARRRRAAARGGTGRMQSAHGHLRWNSGAISSSASACGLLSARATVLARLRRRRAARARRRTPRIGRAAGHAVRKLIGDVEPLRQAVEPGGVVVGKALRRRRPPQRLAEQVVRLHHRSDVGRPAPMARSARRDPFARPLEPCARRRPTLRGAVTSALRHLLEVAVGVEKALASRSTRAAAARRRRNGGRACARRAARSPDGARDRRAPPAPAPRRCRR